MRALIATLLFLSTSCAPKTESLAECARGWWLGASSSCEALCPGPAECGGDCELLSVIGFVESQAVQLAITHSPSGRRFSKFGPVTVDAWAIEASRLRLTSSGTLTESSCHDMRLTIGLSDNVRAPAALATALQAASADNRWAGVSY